MAKIVAIIFGFVFILMGIAGYTQNPIFSQTDALFETNAVHNLGHIFSGIILLGSAFKSVTVAAIALRVFGVIYVLFTILGFLNLGDGTTTELLGLIHINSSDNYLHLSLGLLLILVGSFGQRNELV